MLFMYLIKASHNSEAGNAPSQILQDKMKAYNKLLVDAGIRVMAKGLHPSDQGVRITFPLENGPQVVTHGPFDVKQNLLAGFFIVDVASFDEAVEWAMKIPDPQGFGEGAIEVRQIFD